MVLKMKSKEISHELDKMRIFQKRFELITVSRFRDKSKIKKASSAIDRIRSRTKGGKVSMTSIVRRWRNTRYGNSSS